MTQRRERLLRESLDHALLAFDTADGGEIELRRSDALWRFAMASRLVQDGGDAGAADRWFSDIDTLAEAQRAKPGRATKATKKAS